MSIGRISTFLDIYIERDLKDGILDEARAQELWDQLVQKLRIVRFLRTPDYGCAVQRRSLLGNRMRRRNGSGWTRSGDQEQLSNAAHTSKSGAGARAEHHGSLVEPYAGCLQALLRQSQPRHILVAIRKRRSHAAVLG